VRFGQGGDYPLFGPQSGNPQNLHELAFGVQPREEGVDGLELGVARDGRKPAFAHSHDEPVQTRLA
jgi:hypothetical protein